MSNFKVGDVVKLKSGSPLMTVDEVIINIQTKRPNGLIRCVWFEGTTRKWFDFRDELLVHYQDDI